MILNLISCPRNLSTALMYSFAHHGQIKVIDEPFYGYYLKMTDANHPGKEEVLASMPNQVENILKDIDQINKSHPNIFIKNMAHHLTSMDVSFLLNWTNIFLIRDPRQLIASLAEVINEPNHVDVGLHRQYELMQFLTSNGQNPIVIDSGEILKNPEKALSTLFHHLNIPFNRSMLSWPAGPIPEDGIWAKYWYKNVHKSTGFAVQKTSSRPIPDRLNTLYEECRPYYEKLNSQSIKV